MTPGNSGFIEGYGCFLTQLAKAGFVELNLWS